MDRLHTEGKQLDYRLRETDILQTEEQQIDWGITDILQTKEKELDYRLRYNRWTLG